jgi:hypothetical protein
LQVNAATAEPYARGFTGTIYFNAVKRANLVLGGAGNLASVRLGSDGTNNYTFTNIIIQNGGTLEIDSNPNLNDVGGIKYGGAATLNVTNLDVQTGGLVSAATFGFTQGKGPGAGGVNLPASYGGKGGGATGTTYGSIKNPIHLGSVGFNRHGAGAIIIVASGSMTVNGTISASSPDQFNANSSGGTVNIRTPAIAGTGTIKASGGSSLGGAPTASGGGGRVAVVLSSATSFGALVFQSRGGSGGTDSAGGTVYLEHAGHAPGAGQLFIDNIGTAPLAGTDTRISSLVMDPSVGSISMANGASLNIDTGITMGITAAGQSITGTVGSQIINNGTLNIAGFTGYFGTFTASSGSATNYSGQTDDAPISLLAGTYGNLTLNNAGTSFQLHDTTATVVLNTLAVSAGTLTQTAATLTVNTLSIAAQSAYVNVSTGET